MKYIEEIDLSIRDRTYNAFNNARPSWARAATFVECESWYFHPNNEEDELEEVVLLPDVRAEKMYTGSFSYPKSERLGEQFWVVYKPDFSIFTWFDRKPEDLSQSAMVLVKPIEKNYPDAENLSSITSYLNFLVVKVIPFVEIVNYFEPTRSQEPLIHFHEILQEGKNTYGDNFIKIEYQDLILIEAWVQGDFAAWFICHQCSKQEAPTVIFYTCHPIIESYQFFGNCPLSQEQWKNIEIGCVGRRF